MTYATVTLPSDPVARARRIAHEHTVNGILYMRPDGAIAVVRTSWPYPSSSLVSLSALPNDWVEITA